MKLEQRFIEALKGPICDNCLGRTVGNLLSGMTNEQRGRAIRTHVAFVLDSGERLDVYMPNFRGFKFRNAKPDVDGPTECEICQDFFGAKIAGVVERAAKRLKGMEFSTFLVGSVPSDEAQISEEKLWNRIGVDYVEPIKAEINREVGKRLERETGKKFGKDADIVLLLDLKKNDIRLQVNSVFVSGGYKKLVRGISQTRWLCTKCGGKGCVDCGGEGKRYKTSVQEIIGKPLVKAAEGKDHAFHGAGREDVDARCLDYRPFVLEVVKPRKRGIDLKKAERQINKSKKVKVSGLRFSDKEYVRKIKSDRHDKSYAADVEFEDDIDRKLLGKIRSLRGATIHQQTPNRVRHRRADLTRRRGVVFVSYKTAGRRKLKVFVRGQAGLYIKELISGDDGRTRPSVAELINNKVKKILLDVVKIHKVS